MRAHVRRASWGASSASSNSLSSISPGTYVHNVEKPLVIPIGLLGQSGHLTGKFGPIDGPIGKAVILKDLGKKNFRKACFRQMLQMITIWGQMVCR